MRSEEELTKIIANGIIEIAEEEARRIGEDLDIIVTTERIFIDKYKPEIDVGGLSYEKTIFYVINYNPGVFNFAISNIPVTISCLSLPGETEVAHNILREYGAIVNYRYLNGIVQAYQMPDVEDPVAEVMDGIRAKVTMTGNIRVPEDGVMFITNIIYTDDDGIDHDVPFITETHSWAGTPDPVPFPNLEAGSLGSTMALNKFSTRSLSIVTYLWNYYAFYGDDEFSGNDDGLRFTREVMAASGGSMNKKFRLRLRTNIPDGNGGFLDIWDNHYILTNLGTQQAWGDVSPYSLTFAQAKEID